MAAAAAVLIILGIIGIVVFFVMRSRAGRVNDAPLVKTGEAAAKGASVANAKGGISAQGNVSCAQPLVAPVTGKTCLYYEITVTAEWKDGEQTKTRELTKERHAAQFAIDDGSGPVWIDVREGGSFEPWEKTSRTQSTSLLGGITGQDLMFGQYRVSTGALSLGTKYTVEERHLSAAPKLYVCGKIGSSNEIKAPGWSSLLVTHKSRDEYLGDAAKFAKIALIAGASMLGVGTILGILTPKSTPSTAPATAAPDTGAPAQQPAAGTDTASTTATAATPTSKATTPPVAPVAKPGKRKK